MERKTLYELMNNQIANIESKIPYSILDDFITDKKESVLFIKSLSKVFEVDSDSELYSVAQKRAIHSAITFLMGMVFSEFGNLYKSIASVVGLGEKNNQNIWLQTSLNHDRGYFSNYLKKPDLDYEKTFKYYLFSNSNDGEKLFDSYWFEKEYPNVQAYSVNEILSYDKYVRIFHSKCEGEEKIDHGILGGVITYDGLIREVMKKSTKIDELKNKEILIAKAACLSIAQHNIFKSDNSKTDKLYPDNLLHKLSCYSDFRIGKKTPLLLLLSIVDTIECVKRYSKKQSSNSSDDHFLQAKTILKSIKVEVTKEKIVWDVSELNRKVVEKGFFEDYVEKYWKGILNLKKWTSLNVDKKDSIFTITMN